MCSSRARFPGTVDFNPATGSNNVYMASSGGQYSAFVLKLTSSGGFAWASSFVGQSASGTYG